MNDEEKEEQEANLYSMVVSKNKKKFQNIQKIQTEVNFRNENKHLANWLQYIDGHGKRPNTSPTVITKRFPEKAANKPIVKGRCSNVDAKIFFGSGAKCNIIDKAPFQKIKLCNRNIVLRRDSTNIKCAIGTHLNCAGEVWLTINVGSTFVTLPFKLFLK